MPRGGIRPHRIDGSTEHLLKPKWKSGQTRTIRVPKVLAEQLLEIAHRLDSGESLELTQDNKAEGDGSVIDLKQDKLADFERLKASQAQAIALLQNAITPKSKGGSYAANNATGIKRLVEQALALLGSEGD